MCRQLQKNGIGHWVAVKAYTDYGDSVRIVDPAKSDEVSWSGNISAYYNISASKLTAFCQARGLIW
jgi:hypothetical protein